MSSTFTDASGHAWPIELTIGAALNLKDTLGADLLNLLEGEPPLLTRLDTDYVFLAQVIYCLCAEQADAAGVDQQHFYKALTGPAFKAAHDVLMEKLADFFRALGRDETVEAIKKQQEVVEKAVGMTVQRLRSEEFDRAVDVELRAAGMTPTHGTESGSSPES